MRDIEHLIPKYIAAKKNWKEGYGPKVTLETFASEAGVNQHTLRYHLNKFKKSQIRSKQKVPTKNDNAKGQSDEHKIENHQKFDFDKMRLEFLYGHYPSVKALAIHHGIDPNNGHFRRKTAGWAKEKAILERERRKHALTDFRSESLSETLEDIAATIKSIGRRMNQTLEYPIDMPRDVATKEKMVKILCAVQDFELKQYNSLSVLCQEKRRRELTDLYNKSEISIQEFAGLMDLEGLSLTPSQMEALKASYRNEDEDNYYDFDPEEIERQDAEAERQTRETIERIRQEAEIFKLERSKGVDDLKKELNPKYKDLNRGDVFNEIKPELKSGP